MRWTFPIRRGGKAQMPAAEDTRSAGPAGLTQPTKPAAAAKRAKRAKSSGPRSSGPRWWEARRAQNRKPATYTCPLCHQLLPALSEHMLLFPEGDHGHRRHAHTACVMRARKEGRLPTRDEWLASQR